jgi:hypothetical protein
MFVNARLAELANAPILPRFVHPEFFSTAPSVAPINTSLKNPQILRGFRVPGLESYPAWRVLSPR